MMQENWLRTKLVDGVAESSDSQTKKIDLPTSNFISKLDLRCRATVNNASNDADFAHLFLDQIDKIRVVGDGFSTIVDLNPKQLRYMMAPIVGGIPSQNFTATEAEYSIVDLPIYFGHYPHDTDAILPAKLFKSLQLEIEYSMETADPAWDTGTFTIYLECEEYISNDDPTTKQIIRRTQVKSGTTSSGTIDVDLPLGGIYKRIFVLAEDPNVAEGTSITDVQFRVNNGSEIPMSAGWDVLGVANMEDLNLPPASLHGTTCKANDDTIITDLGIVDQIQVHWLDENATSNAISLVSVDAIAGGTCTLDANITAALTQATDGNRTIGADSTVQLLEFHATTVHSALPECVVIVFDKGGNLRKCPDSSKFNDAKVRLTGADANAAYSVCLEEMLQVPG